MAAFAIAGAASYLLTVVIAQSIDGASLDDIIDDILGNTDAVAVGCGRSAILWVIGGYALMRSGRATTLGAIALRIILAFAAITLIPMLLSGMRLHSLIVSSFTLIGLAKAIVLNSLASWLGGQRADYQNRWTRCPPINHAPDQVTRLLCGQAVLGGPEFRQKILGAFENHWSALAPEIGVDMPLVMLVAADERRRDQAYQWGFAAIGITSLILISASPELIPLAVAVIAGALLYGVKTARVRERARRFTPGHYNPEATRNEAQGNLEPETAIPSTEQNLVVYSGFSPFVGYGEELGGWSVVIATDRPSPDGVNETKRFSTEQLYHAIGAAVSEAVPQATCRDMFFASGTDIRNDRNILWAGPEYRPRDVLDDNEAATTMAACSQRVRHFKAIQVIDWGGEIVLTYFVRCELRGRSLAIETKRFLLPPIAGAFRRVDLMIPDSMQTRAGFAVQSLFAGPLVTVISTLAAVAEINQALGKMFHSRERDAKRRARNIEQDPLHDFGATTSVRQSLSQSVFQHHFQKSDADIGMKRIEQKLLDELVKFLDDHGIDTTDLRERSLTILNSGILVQGGNVRADSLAIGTNAKATTSNSAGKD